jgi:hypothetical protein
MLTAQTQKSPSPESQAHHERMEQKRRAEERAQKLRRIRPLISKETRLPRLKSKLPTIKDRWSP